MLILAQVVSLCKSFEAMERQPIDLFYAFRCMSIDIITCQFLEFAVPVPYTYYGIALCFGNSVNAVYAPDHEAPIILAMDASLPVLVRFKHAAWYKNMIIHCPPTLSKIISPEIAGLVDLQQALKKQISDATSNPGSLKKLPHSSTIYNQLLDPENYGQEGSGFLKLV